MRSQATSEIVTFTMKDGSPGTISAYEKQVQCDGFTVVKIIHEVSEGEWIFTCKPLISTLQLRSSCN